MYASSHLFWRECLGMQVQWQLFCTKRVYLWFVLRTNKAIHMNDFFPQEYFWRVNVAKVLSLFFFLKTTILPELKVIFSPLCSSISEIPFINGVITGGITTFLLWDIHFIGRPQCFWKLFFFPPFFFAATAKVQMRMIRWV